MAAEGPAPRGAGRRRASLTSPHKMHRRGIQIGTRVRAYLACILGIVLGLGVFGFVGRPRLRLSRGASSVGAGDDPRRQQRRDCLLGRRRAVNLRVVPNFAGLRESGRQDSCASTWCRDWAAGWRPV